MADMPRFEHIALDHPLTQIRLLYIPLIPQPIGDGDMLRCQLQTFNLCEMRNKFSAVSYAWGDKANPRTISVNNGSFSVSENLWWFIHHISLRQREPDKFAVPPPFESLKKIIRWFWIDQICIDQSRRTERNHQVNIMSNIYASAERVLVWLGRPADLSNSAATPSSDEYNEQTKYTKPNHHTLVDHLDEVAHCSYWSRLWIIQEIMLGAEVTVLFGSVAEQWSLVRPWFRRRDDLPCPIIVQRKSIPSLMTNKYALHRALELFSSYECEDPRDKVYGLQGIVHETERIEVDYKKTAAAIYWDAVAAFRTKQLREPARIIALGFEMAVSGQEEVCKELGLVEKFQLLFAGKHPALVFQPQ